MFEELEAYLRPGKSVFLVGIGGIGMSGLARILRASGLKVGGSDVRESAEVMKLRQEGIGVIIGHPGSFTERPDMVIFSSAISKDNNDLVTARASGIPIRHRAEVLATIMNQGISMAITGTHGKTTCAALTSFLLTKSGFQPSCLVGGEVRNFNSNVLVGHPYFYVAEIDESDRSHLHFSPDIVLLTSLEAEHLDVYRGIKDLKNSFQSFAGQIQKTGKVVYCADDPHLEEVVATCPSQTISYGLLTKADYTATDVSLSGFGATYVLREKGKRIDTVTLKIPGLHNVANSLGVIALLRGFGLRYTQFLKAISDFLGVSRRLEVKLERPEMVVIDDYAHHPTEVKASLAAISGLRKRTTVVFQPHRYSRTAQLSDEFSQALSSASRVVLTDIYSAGESNPDDIKPHLIADSIRKRGHKDAHVISRDKIIDFLNEKLKDDETVAFLGAGDIGEIADEFAGRFENTYTH